MKKYAFFLQLVGNKLYCRFNINKPLYEWRQYRLIKMTFIGSLKKNQMKVLTNADRCSFYDMEHLPFDTRQARQEELDGYRTNINNKNVGLFRLSLEEIALLGLELHQSIEMKVIKVGEVRKKDTDQVKTSPEKKGNTTHGGDSNSGEVDSKAQTMSQEKRDNKSKSGQSIVVPKAPYKLKVFEDKKAGKSSPVRNRFAGKKTDGSSCCDVKPELISTREAKDLKRILQKIFNDFLKDSKVDAIGTSHPSHRLDGRKLVKELVSKRYDMSKIRRDELASAPKTIILAADTSGSCSTSCDKTVGICLSLVKEWPEVIYIEHFNGYPTAVHTQKGVQTIVSDEISDLGQWWIDVSKMAKGAILFGDYDGIYSYSNMWLCNNVPTLLLDDFGSSHDNVYPDTFSDPTDVGYRFRHPKFSRTKGVQGAFSAAKALRMYRRNR